MQIDIRAMKFQFYKTDDHTGHDKLILMDTFKLNKTVYNR